MINEHWRETKLKKVHRAYVPYFVPHSDNAEARSGSMCSKCETLRPILMHCMWLCPHIAQFWDRVGRHIRLVMGLAPPNTHCFNSSVLRTNLW